jgi:diguanylate cyclase
VITSMIELARALHLNVVAEGVETSTDLESVRRLGVDVAQGYFVAHPLTSAQLDDFLALDHSFANNQLLPTRSA